MSWKLFVFRENMIAKTIQSIKSRAAPLWRCWNHLNISRKQINSMTYEYILETADHPVSIAFVSPADTEKSLYVCDHETTISDVSYDEIFETENDDGSSKLQFKSPLKFCWQAWGIGIEQCLSNGEPAEPVDVADEFYYLARSWKRERDRFAFSAQEMAEHQAYTAIIGMGECAIPYILNELRKEPDHWFLALSEIAGVDPVPVSDRGRIRAISEAWINWGKENGYL